MTFICRIKNRLLRGAKANFSLGIYAVLIAILAWFIISMTLYPSVPKTIENIELSLDLSGSTADESGLSVIQCDIENVDIRIKGSRTQVGTLNSDSFIAHIDTTNISTPGKKTLPITIECKNNASYEIESISPESVTVVLDKYTTIDNIPVTPKIPNISLAEGKTIDTESLACEPAIVSVYGPSAQISKIKECYVVSDMEKTLAESYSVTSTDIQLIAEDGTVIDPEKMKITPASFQINIPVLTQKEVGLAVNLGSVPQGLDEKWLLSKIKLSDDSVIVASRNSQSEFPENIDLGTISVRDIGLDYSASMSVSRVLDAANLINRSGLDSVTVSLDSSDLATKEITLSKDRIRVSNRPADGYDYNVNTKSLPITVVGQKDMIEAITENDFYAEASLLNADTSLDEFSYDVTITCPAYNKVWAIKKSKVVIVKTEKPTQPTTTSSDDETETKTTTD